LPHFFFAFTLLFPILNNSSPASASTVSGLLFIVDMLPLRVVHGTTVDLGGQAWKVTILDDSLELSQRVSTNNRKEQKQQAWANVAHELARRREEAAALSSDVARHMKLCEQVEYALVLE
jgi:hypothetical protein